jgi:hypothetical protein
MNPVHQQIQIIPKVNIEKPKSRKIPLVNHYIVRIAREMIEKANLTKKKKVTK